MTEKAGGPFTAEDQELVETLASQAAVAIENARLLRDATNWSARLEALNEVAGITDLLQLSRCRVRSSPGGVVDGDLEQPGSSTGVAAIRSTAAWSDVEPGSGVGARS